ncbi:hypothetical protein ACFQV2_30285 [Actinokineospora soli]|uniref:Uncharacterized protein n=1 Tax=Actinokineospora soli TaxID=1048753 RepID=A0ABW2TUT3_9PSEU
MTGSPRRRADATTSAVPPRPGGPAVPHGDERVDPVEHVLVGGGVRGLARLGVRQGAHAARASEERVEVGGAVRTDDGPVVGGREHDVDRAAEAEHDPGEHLVRAPGEAGDADQVRLVGEFGLDRVRDERHRGLGQVDVAGDAHPHGPHTTGG